VPASNPISNADLVTNPTTLSTPAANTAFIDDYSTMGLGGTEGGYDPLFPNMPPLPPTSLSGMDYLGWDMGMGMGMGSNGGGTAYGTAYGSTMMPVLNMPPLSPTTAEKRAAEKREREEGGEGHTQPAQKKRRKENTAATRGQRATRGARGRVARGACAD
jgi:hypothetical protein